ncbi:DUF3710 domain-containing protein [Amycolatopsis suaedae]|uniref:DUF3710 domain-containing protein n=1 Tax=Amycolatopsis suaedae TaxID=2510978 RepID=A0A4Q7J644_9PSEU|nr:DUF3710 domain-containing protein [Amycolatopsis suaedae]RZQ63071.1 DUF3710 domain-containing protein [Amycolatopsis suaedae]
MAIFGRKRRAKAQRAYGRHARPDHLPSVVDHAELEDSESESVVTTGPFDVADAVEDGIPRIDLGSVRVPVPEGAQVQVEMDAESGGVRAVHVVTQFGQVTISAYAAPKSGGLWDEVCDELNEQLKADGARVTAGGGEWGRELSAIVGEVALRFVGVDGPRWMLRGVIAGPQSAAAQAPDALRELVRGTIVNRGDAPMPVRTPLPITLPDAVAQHIAEQQGQ